MRFEIFAIGRDSLPSRWWWAFCTFSHRVKLSSRSSRSGSIVPLLSGIANQHLSICKCMNCRSRHSTTLHSNILFFQAQHVFLYLFCNNCMVFLCFIDERSLLLKSFFFEIRNACSINFSMLVPPPLLYSLDN